MVSGGVTPDHWVVDKRSGNIIECKISQKTIQHTLDAVTEKACTLEVEPDQQCAACLTSHEITALARLGERIESHFRRPQDIEWAVDKDEPANIFILQTRDEKFHIELHLAGF